MKEHIFSDFGTRQCNSFQTTNMDNNYNHNNNATDTEEGNEMHLSGLYSTLQTCMNEELLGSYFKDAEPERIDFSRWLNEQTLGSVNGIKGALRSQSLLNQTSQQSESDLPATFDHFSAKPSPTALLQRLKEQRINLILVATSLDENQVAERLERTLNPNTCKVIPLSFESGNDEPLLHERQQEESTFEKDVFENSKEDNSDNNVQKSKRVSVKQKLFDSKDDRYWKRRNNNNKAAKRSREAKRARLAWIESRSNELEVENARLEEQLKSIKSKMVEMESCMNRIASDPWK